MNEVTKNEWELSDDSPVVTMADSVGPCGIRLTSFLLRFPRNVLAEFNTHRMFSRSSASSRAIPIERMIKRCVQNPYMPKHWGKNQGGMQANHDLDPAAIEQARAEMLEARDDAVRHVSRLSEIGLHKQITNRLLEPFQWHVVIVTATHWANFFGLRDHKDAEPHFRDVAAAAHELYKNGKPRHLNAGQWHLPMIRSDEIEISEDGHYKFRWTDAVEPTDALEIAKVATGRCGRLSYLNHDGIRDPHDDVSLHDRMRAAAHWSAFEHCAVARSWGERRNDAVSAFYKWLDDGVPVGNFDPAWLQYRKMMPDEHNAHLEPGR